MSVYYREAKDAEGIAKLLRTRGRMVITAPPRCGKTTELLKYAEERYPNGRFVVVAKEEDHAYITQLHWRIYNGITFAEAIAARLLGKELNGEDVNPPRLVYPEMAWARVFNPSTPWFVDGWDVLTENAKREITKRRLFIAAVSDSSEG